jgi:hypothetical protein
LQLIGSVGAGVRLAPSRTLRAMVSGFWHASAAPIWKLSVRLCAPFAADG